MKITIPDFAELTTALKQLKQLCGTKVEYIEISVVPEHELLEIRTGHQELSARYRIRGIKVEGFDPQRPRWGSNLETLEDLLAGKKGAGTINVAPQSSLYNIGKFEVKCPNEQLRAKQSKADDVPAAGKAKKTTAIGYYYNFPEPSVMGEPHQILKFQEAYTKIALEDQSKGVFAKGAFFGIRITTDAIHHIAYDSYHIGYQKVVAESPYQADEDGIILDVVVTRSMAQRLARALGDDFRLRVGTEDTGDGNWLVCYNEGLAISLRTFEIRYGIPKVIKHLYVESEPLFTVADIGDVTAFSKRRSRAMATVTCAKAEAMFTAKDGSIVISEPVEARDVVDGEGFTISCKALLDCCVSLAGAYTFSATPKFVKISNDEQQFLIIRGNV